METRQIRWRAGPLLAVIAASVLAMAACGDDSSDGDSATASGGSGTSSANSDRAVEYSECMRENGVPNFPDPENGRITLRVGPDSGIDPNSEEYKAAEEACRSKAPQGGTSGGDQAGGQMEEQVLRYAECMRANGVPDYPDPEVSGGRVSMRLPPGVDTNSEQFQSAERECQSILQGLGGAP